MKVYLYRRPQRPVWASQEKQGVTYEITYHPNPGGRRKEVVDRFEEIVRIIRTSFTRNSTLTLNT